MPKLKTNHSTRRRFLKNGFMLMASPAMISSKISAQPEIPNISGKCHIGVIGLGARGFHLMQSFLRQEDVHVRAVCDVDRVHYRSNAWGQGQAYGLESAKRVVDFYAKNKRRSAYNGCLALIDYRDLCARDDIDAVVVATPDHWHYHQIMEALAHGKDVYCEKPLTHTFMEGKIIHREVVRKRAIFQTGSQQRSTANFQKAVALVRNGYIGRLRRVEVGLPPGYTKPRSDTRIQPVPPGLDYDRWNGPAPLLPYMRARHHQLWRGHLAYGGGNIMDWIGHHNDIAHWGAGMDQSGPTEVRAVGWTSSETDIYNTPVDYEIHCVYPGNIEWLIASKLKMGTKWIGENGWIYVNRGRLEASDPRWLEKGFAVGPLEFAMSSNHVRNFIDGVRSRRACIAPAETAHRSITAGHLGYVSHRLGRRLVFDPHIERVLNDTEANTLLDKSYRKPWRI